MGNKTDSRYTWRAILRAWVLKWEAPETRTGRSRLLAAILSTINDRRWSLSGYCSSVRIRIFDKIVKKKRGQITTVPAGRSELKIYRGKTYFPVPLRLTDCGDPAALSVTVNDAVSAPVFVGLNLTEIVQLAPAATVAPQVVVSEKEDAFVPLILMPPDLISKVALPVFLSVTTLAAVVVPTFVVANFREVGVSETTGAPVPVPLRATV
jgi:hypothetical protein